MDLYPRWMYHKTEEPKIVENEEDFDTLKADGWRESPAPFINIKNFNIDPDDAVGIQQLGDTVQGVADALNGAIQLDQMDKDQLEDYAQEHFGVDLDRRKGVKKLRAEVQTLIDGPTTH